MPPLQGDVHPLPVALGFGFALLLAGLVVLASMVTLWGISLILRDSSIVDVFWGAGFVLVAWIVAGVTDGTGARRAIIIALVTLWGVRLTTHLYLRNRGKGEDPRYARWREAAGPSWWWKSAFKVFLLQGAVMLVVIAPVVAALASPAPIGMVDILAIPVWAVGFVFETVGDWQLARFKEEAANRGRLLTTGLWRFTRHPNYFGDATAWWGIWLVAVGAGAWWTFPGPLLMTFLLLKVSGVAMLEKDLRQTKPGYEEYVASTNAFIPWFPKGPDRTGRTRRGSGRVQP